MKGDFQNGFSDDPTGSRDSRFSDCGVRRNVLVELQDRAAAQGRNEADDRCSKQQHTGNH
jgi:hypothetical protein